MNQAQRVAIAGKNIQVSYKAQNDKSLLLEEKVGGFSRSDEARNPPLWQIQADAAPMRQRALQALALQNDYAEL